MNIGNIISVYDNVVIDNYAMKYSAYMGTLPSPPFNLPTK